MSKLNFKGSIANKNQLHTFQLSLFSFMDDGCRIIYSPALDLSGYGKTETEAKESFKIAFSAFVEYTSNKNSLLNELKRLGWQVSNTKLKKNKPIEAPVLAKLLESNDYLATIFDTKNFKKYNEFVELPV